MNVKRRRRVLLTTLGLVLGLPLALQAQAQVSPEQVEARLLSMMEEVLEHLALSEEKEARARPILKQSVDKQVEILRQAIARRDRSGRDAIRREMETINEETARLLAEVLSPEEMERYNTMQREQADQERGGAPSPQAPRRGGLISRFSTVTYFGLGANHIDAGALSGQLAGQGYERLAEGLRTRSQINQVFVGRFTLGLEISSIQQQEVTNTATQAALAGTYTLVSLGYVLLARGGLRVYPSAGIGRGSYTMTLQPFESADSFEDVLGSPQQGAELKNSNWLLNTGMGADYTLPFRLGRLPRLSLGMRAGYLTALSTKEWRLFGDDGLGTTPGLSQEGPYLRIMLGLSLRGPR